MNGSLVLNQTLDTANPSVSVNASLAMEDEDVDVGQPAPEPIAETTPARTTSPPASSQNTVSSPKRSLSSGATTSSIPQTASTPKAAPESELTSKPAPEISLPAVEQSLAPPAATVALATANASPPNASHSSTDAEATKPVPAKAIVPTLAQGTADDDIPSEPSVSATPPRANYNSLLAEADYFLYKGNYSPEKSRSNRYIKLANRAPGATSPTNPSQPKEANTPTQAKSATSSADSDFVRDNVKRAKPAKRSGSRAKKSAAMKPGQEEASHSESESQSVADASAQVHYSASSSGNADAASEETYDHLIDHTRVAAKTSPSKKVAPAKRASSAKAEAIVEKTPSKSAAPKSSPTKAVNQSKSSKNHPTAPAGILGREAAELKEMLSHFKSTQDLANNEALMDRPRTTRSGNAATNSKSKSKSKFKFNAKVTDARETGDEADDESDSSSELSESESETPAKTAARRKLAPEIEAVYEFPAKDNNESGNDTDEDDKAKKDDAESNLTRRYSSSLSASRSLRATGFQTAQKLSNRTENENREIQQIQDFARSTAQKSKKPTDIEPQPDPNPDDEWMNDPLYSSTQPPKNDATFHPGVKPRFQATKTYTKPKKQSDSEQSDNSSAPQAQSSKTCSAEPVVEPVPLLEKAIADIIEQRRPSAPPSPRRKPQATDSEVANKQSHPSSRPLSSDSESGPNYSVSKRKILTAKRSQVSESSASEKEIGSATATPASPRRTQRTGSRPTARDDCDDDYAIEGDDYDDVLTAKKRVNKKKRKIDVVDSGSDSNGDPVSKPKKAKESDENLDNEFGFDISSIKSAGLQRPPSPSKSKPTSGDEKSSRWSRLSSSSELPSKPPSPSKPKRPASDGDLNSLVTVASYSQPVAVASDGNELLLDFAHGSETQPLPAVPSAKKAKKFSDNEGYESSHSQSGSKKAATDNEADRQPPSAKRPKRVTASGRGSDSEGYESSGSQSGCTRPLRAAAKPQPEPILEDSAEMDNEVEVEEPRRGGRRVLPPSPERLFKLERQQQRAAAAAAAAAAAPSTTSEDIVEFGATPHVTAPIPTADDIQDADVTDVAPQNYQADDIMDIADTNPMPVPQKVDDVEESNEEPSSYSKENSVSQSHFGREPSSQRQSRSLDRPQSPRRKDRSSSRESSSSRSGSFSASSISSVAQVVPRSPSKGCPLPVISTASRNNPKKRMLMEAPPASLPEAPFSSDSQESMHSDYQSNDLMGSLTPVMAEFATGSRASSKVDASMISAIMDLDSTEEKLSRVGSENSLAKTPSAYTVLPDSVVDDKMDVEPIASYRTLSADLLSAYEEMKHSILERWGGSCLLNCFEKGVAFNSVFPFVSSWSLHFPPRERSSDIRGQWRRLCWPIPRGRCAPYWNDSSH
jgi:hypothetical protein